MTNEEKKAVETLKSDLAFSKSLRKRFRDEQQEKDYETIINLLEKQDNRIKELESDKEIKDKTIDLMAFAISSYDGQLVINQYKDRNEVKAKFKEYVEDGTYEQYFENLANLVSSFNTILIKDE